MIRRIAAMLVLAFLTATGCAVTSNQPREQLKVQPRIILDPTPPFAPREVTAVAEEARRSLAVVICCNERNEYQGQGSGFHIAPGYVLTSAHAMLAGGRSRFAIAFADYRPRLATPVLADTPADMLLLEIDANDRDNLPPCIAVRTTAPRWAEDVLVLGFPRRPFLEFIPNEIERIFSPTVTRGIVSGVNIEIGNPATSLLLVDAGVAPGNSGGPVVGMDGKVIGLVQGLSLMDTYQGYAIPNGRIWSSFGRIMRNQTLAARSNSGSKK